jgi:predicted transcriptional regulator
MTPRLSRPEIKLAVLDTCTGNGANLTKIVHSANLNFKTVHPYINELLQSGLIVMVGNKYQTTQAGQAAARMLRASGLV